MSGITITSPMLTTWGQQNVAGSSGSQGFFPYAWRPNPGGTNFSNIKPGWMCDQTGTYVSAVGDGITDFTITLVSGTFTSGGFYSFTGKGGVTFGQGVTIGAGSSPPPSGNGVIGYSEMPPPVAYPSTLEDPTSTSNGSVGFTINDQTKTGVAVSNCSANNISWINTNYTVGNIYTCTWGAGSTVASSPVLISNLPNGFANPFVFFIQGQTGAATYNYPFTFSV